MRPAQWKNYVHEWQCWYYAYIMCIYHWLFNFHLTILIDIRKLFSTHSNNPIPILSNTLINVQFLQSGIPYLYFSLYITCNLVSRRPNLGLCRRDSLIPPILTTTFYFTFFGSLNQAKNTLRFEWEPPDTNMVL